MIVRNIILISLMMVLDILAISFTSNKLLIIILLMLINIMGIFTLYYWLINPVTEMKKKLNEVEEENKKVENIRKEFVANVSHELKTPLTSISGFIETLQNGALEDPEISRRFIDIVAIETARLKRLISDLLLLSDIESKTEVQNAEFSLANVFNSTILMLNPIAKKRNINLNMELQKDILLTGSEDKFRQMIVNLIENGIKYTNEGGYVEISALENEDTITIKVKDNGIGIDEKDLERIAERFYRVDKSRSKKIGGTGLGLSIVKHTASLFDGELFIESKIGEGSVFKIIIKKQK